MCEKAGSDENNDGLSETTALASAVQALLKFDDVQILVRKTEGFEPISGAALKKAKKLADAKKRKQAKAAEQKAADAEAEQRRLEDAKKVTISEDATLPKATRTKIRHAESLRGKRIDVRGWVHRLRAQGSSMWFLIVRDGTGFMQCVLSGDLCKTYDALTLSIESTVRIVGTLKELPEGKDAPDGHELQADFWEVIAKSLGGEEAYQSKLNVHSGPDVLLDNRHLHIRGEQVSAILKMRSIVQMCFRQWYFSKGFYEITPPSIVQTQVEGGSTLFNLSYFGEPSYLTQSSQLYLETVLPAVGDCFTMAESYRAEKSHTRRHLAQYTHMEGELAFIDFEELLDHMEALICETIDLVLANPEAQKLIPLLNKSFQPPKRPFRRMRYAEAIEWLNQNNVLLEESDDEGDADEAGDALKPKTKRPFRFGDDIPESPERRMVDTLNEPIFLTHFPTAIKPFYMKQCESDNSVVEAVDLLMPNVGEVIGGSMREDKLDLLLEGFKRSGISPEHYYWYVTTDGLPGVSSVANASGRYCLGTMTRDGMEAVPTEAMVLASNDCLRGS